MGSEMCIRDRAIDYDSLLLVATSRGLQSNRILELGILLAGDPRFFHFSLARLEPMTRIDSIGLVSRPTKTTAAVQAFGIALR